MRTMIVRASVALVACALAWLPSCATVPSQYSARSAASPQAVEAPRATIGLALREDPPLPGASTDGWTGLAPPSGGGMPMGHMHHHGMDMQGMEGMDMQGMHSADTQPAPDAGQACMAGMDMGPCNSPASDADAGAGSRSHAH